MKWSTLAWALAAPFAMRRGPVAAFESWRHARPTAPPILAADELISAADEVLLLRVAGRLVFRTRCLKRTLVLWCLLRTHGHDPLAIIGFDREGDGLAGHAWLDLNGERVPDPVFTPPRGFVPFLALGDQTLAFNDGQGAAAGHRLL